MYLWDLALRKGCLGCIKYILKSSLMKLPVSGWGFHVFEFLSVERKWDVDEKIMRKMLSTFTDPLWHAVFPEGTYFTEQKCIKSQRFAAENGLPILKNVLLPKSRGFHACVEILRGSLDAVYDVTIAYKNRCPTFMDNVFGIEPSEVHIHIPPENIPISESECNTWLLDTFRDKDELLSDFIAQGHFPNQGTVKRSFNNQMLVKLHVSDCNYFNIFSFSSSVWFKVYVVFSCAHLSFATACDFRSSPIVDHVKGLLSRNKSC